MTAGQARVSPGPMKSYKGPQIPARQEQARPKTAHQKIADALLEHGPITSTDLIKASGTSSGTVSRVTNSMIASGELIVDEPDHPTKPRRFTLIEWQERENERKRRTQAVQQNGNVGYPDTENDLEEEDDEPAVAEDAGIVDHEADKDLDTQKIPSDDPMTDVDLANRALALAGAAVHRMESALAKTANEPKVRTLPANDDRVTALRRLVPLVSDDIGEALTEVLDRVTGKEAA